MMMMAATPEARYLPLQESVGLGKEDSQFFFGERFLNDVLDICITQADSEVHCFFGMVGDITISYDWAIPISVWQSFMHALQDAERWVVKLLNGQKVKVKDDNLISETARNMAQAWDKLDCVVNTDVNISRGFEIPPPMSSVEEDPEGMPKHTEKAADFPVEEERPAPETMADHHVGEASTPDNKGRRKRACKWCKQGICTKHAASQVQQ